MIESIKNTIEKNLKIYSIAKNDVKVKFTFFQEEMRIPVEFEIYHKDEENEFLIDAFSSAFGRIEIRKLSRKAAIDIIDFIKKSQEFRLLVETGQLTFSYRENCTMIQLQVKR
jgi:hypothetical protein